MDFLAIGEEELVVAFRLLGIPGVAVNGREETAGAFRAATGGGAAPDSRAGEAAARLVSASGLPKVLVLNATAMADLGDAAREWQLAGDYPLLVEIPDLAGWPAGRETLVESIRKAVGIQV